MAKLEVYRIKNTETGLYYTGRIFGPYKNPNYTGDYEKAKILKEEFINGKTRDELVENEYYRGNHPWNKYYTPLWNEIGKIFVNKRGAEHCLSRLTKTSKKIRSSKGSNILFGNSKSNNYIIVVCEIKDVK